MSHSRILRETFCFRPARFKGISFKPCTLTYYHMKVRIPGRLFDRTIFKELFPLFIESPFYIKHYIKIYAQLLQHFKKTSLNICMITYYHMEINISVRYDNLIGLFLKELLPFLKKGGTVLFTLIIYVNKKNIWEGRCLSSDLLTISSKMCTQIPSNTLSGNYKVFFLMKDERMWVDIYTGNILI